MTVGDCPTRQRIPHDDPGANVHILQIASDGGNSLYQVQVNQVPDTELHMEMLDSGNSAIVHLRRGPDILESTGIETTGDTWVAKAHTKVEGMLNRYYVDAVFSWYTRGLNVER